MTEKNPCMLAEIIDMVTPEQGAVLDPYAGTLSTALGCLKAHRSCISIEKRDDCFTEGMLRLRRVVSPVSLEKYISDPLDAYVTPQRDNADIPAPTPAYTMLEKDVAHLCHDKDDILPSNTTDEPSETQTSRHSESRMSPIASSIRAVTRSNDPTHHLIAGGDVELLTGDIVVATATLLAPPCTESGKVARKLHGCLLSTVERGNQHLVAVILKSISSDAADVPFPYTCPGQEGTPETVGGAYKGGLYPWDASSVRMVQSQTM